MVTPWPTTQLPLRFRQPAQPQTLRCCFVKYPAWLRFSMHSAGPSPPANRPLRSAESLCRRCATASAAAPRSWQQLVLLSSVTAPVGLSHQPPPACCMRHSLWAIAAAAAAARLCMEVSAAAWPQCCLQPPLKLHSRKPKWRSMTASQSRCVPVPGIPYRSKDIVGGPWDIRARASHPKP